MYVPLVVPIPTYRVLTCNFINSRERPNAVSGAETPFTVQGNPENHSIYFLILFTDKKYL